MITAPLFEKATSGVLGSLLPIVGRELQRSIVFIACIAGPTAVNASTEKSLPAPEPAQSQVADFLHDLLPIAWQKKPQERFNSITEMTEEGRKRRVPSPSQPMYFYAEPAQFVQTGEVIPAGEKPPPGAELEAAMRTALAENGYLPIAGDGQRPDVLIVFTYGSSGTDNIHGERNADELLQDLIDEPDRGDQGDLAKLAKDAILRARLVAGNKFARDLYAALQNQILWHKEGIPDPPIATYMRSYRPEVIEHFVEMAFHTCYFVTATAYDFEGVARKQKIPLWQTRMAVEAQGVSMTEILKPLILNAGSALGREQDPGWVTKRLNRDGHVDVGTATVVEEPKPAGASEIPAAH